MPVHVMKKESHIEELSFTYTGEEERERDCTLALNLQQTLTEYPRHAWLLNTQEQHVVRKALHAFIAAQTERMRQRRDNDEWLEEKLRKLEKDAAMKAAAKDAPDVP